MLVYYQNTEYVSGKHRIVSAVYDRDFFPWRNTTNNCSCLVIDEIDPANKEICLDIVNTISKVDAGGDSKYYISNGALYEKDG